MQGLAEGLQAANAAPERLRLQAVEGFFHAGRMHPARRPARRDRGLGARSARFRLSSLDFRRYKSFLRFFAVPRRVGSSIGRAVAF